MAGQRIVQAARSGQSWIGCSAELSIECFVKPASCTSCPSLLRRLDNSMPGTRPDLGLMQSQLPCHAPLASPALQLVTQATHLRTK